MNPSKQFWKSFDTSAGYKLQVEERDGKQVGLVVYHPDLSTRGMNIPADLAPALALAILEAAGWPEDDLNSATRTIMQDLRCVVEFDERKAKEASDREALEAEAWELWLAYHPSTAHKSFSDLLPPGQNDFLNIARKAREIHKAKS